MIKIQCFMEICYYSTIEKTVENKLFKQQNIFLVKFVYKQIKTEIFI